MEFISLPESIKQKIYQNLLPCDLIQLGATCQTLHNSIYNDDLLCQLSLIDHYNEYVIGERSEKLFKFETFEQTSGSDCLNIIYPNLVKNYVNEQKTHFCPLNSFIPHIPNDIIQVSLIFTLGLYYIPYIYPLVVFSPLCILAGYFRNIKNQIQPTINSLCHSDKIIKKRLFYSFIIHIEVILPFFFLPILLPLVFVYPILLLAPLGLFAFNFFLKQKLVPVLIGYTLSIIPTLIIYFFKPNPEILVTLLLPAVIVFLISINSKHIQKKIIHSEFGKRCIIGLFIGGVIGIIYAMTTIKIITEVVIGLILIGTFVLYRRSKE
ncbi:hypothetical protein EDI_092390 [Entamoeba dispar SAW760]|uniref:F-box domain-containing protein n=1 Tax=Entamoeba dispar (strain ATCC PRA-260 / SAW760) TaxID=370354 RepID=B0ED31_ENTDS|nr:uncharacterized protein EDI_092390 [Entamoeba dispar SAW760]EDR27448.1 hypothetical protein EDI_092390 [Entamoeba dispar SAW760]|eukprot:EDR27448.1 hypothetical protein EDI_092390 [Entamoeba dispar SAW760]